MFLVLCLLINCINLSFFRSYDNSEFADAGRSRRQNGCACTELKVGMGAG